jgi:plasmid stabilization system protein ParE
MAFRVKQTPQADRDLDTILDWLLERQAGEAGLRWFRKLSATDNRSERKSGALAAR